MQMPDIEVFKEIPGYKAILKAVLKTQIQTLVEQLSKQTGEETVIVTASLEDGSLTHLGSDFGKVFLDSHDEIKSQFLGFCLKRNQMIHKTQMAATSTVRKKGPLGRRPRLTPYSTNVTARKAPRKGTPRSLQTQRFSEYNHGYPQNLEPVYSQTGDGYKQSAINEMNAVVKTEPGLENETDGENQVYIENMSRAFPSNSFHGDGETSEVESKTEGLPGTHLFGAENQPGKEGDQGQMKMENVDGGGGGGHHHIIKENGSPSGSGLNLGYHKVHSKKVTTKVSQRGRKIKMTAEADDEFFYDESSRPYPCHQCPKRFKERHHLTYHLRTHSGHRPYVCNVCSKSFTQSSSLNTHKKIHLNEINCGVCGSTFRKKSDFTLHICKEISMSDYEVEPAQIGQDQNNQSGETAMALGIDQSLQDDMEVYLENKTDE